MYKYEKVKYLIDTTEFTVWYNLFDSVGIKSNPFTGRVPWVSRVVSYWSDARIASNGNIGTALPNVKIRDGNDWLIFKS